MSHESEAIYNLSLHEKCYLDEETMVRRVPGGWIYTYMYIAPQLISSVTSVFVPFNNEFQSEFDGVTKNRG